jgi:PAS fold
MLGHRNLAMKHMDDWKQLVHPDDREATLVALLSHVGALTPLLEFECRVRHGDGSYRRLHSRHSGASRER